MKTLDQLIVELVSTEQHHADLYHNVSYMIIECSRQKTYLWKRTITSDLSI